VILSHPVICYFLRRYDLPLAWVIEWVEGKEPTAKDVALAIRRAGEEEVVAVFAPPEFSRRAAELVAESAGLRVLLVDPLGGVAGLETYDDLLRAIAKAIAEGAR
jgi:ABC-type Zn uptake system ZnuABC Zn-binding protein ZnuA